MVNVLFFRLSDLKDHAQFSKIHNGIFSYVKVQPIYDLIHSYCESQWDRNYTTGTSFRLLIKANNEFYSRQIKKPLKFLNFFFIEKIKPEFFSLT